jgi:7,8-dihydroneopterin aldolase/epimerase/oxygenase
MSATMTITLNGLRFHAFHGLYPEEQKTGNEFEVDLAVEYSSPAEIITAIEDTINYVSLHTIIKRAMQQPVHLLETLAMEIVEQIHQSYPEIINATISIQKLHPPVEQFTGSVGVRYHKKFGAGSVE